MLAPTSPFCSQLLLGFVLPTFIIWSAELRSRRAFLAARHSDGAAGGAHAELAGAALRHLPGLVDYLMFAVPGGGWVQRGRNETFQTCLRECHLF